MLTDLHLRFDGFWGSLGQCHIRLCQNGDGKPLIITCSQYNNYVGTSVTNALESVAKALFHHIANGKIENVRFNFELPIIDEEHPDVNLLDRALMWLAPKKYRPRFITKKLDIPKIFEQVVWLEHYPPNRSSMRERHLRRVQMSSTGAPVWHGLQQEEWFIGNLGYSTKDLIPPDKDLDLAKISLQAKELYESGEVLEHFDNFQVIYWVGDLVKYLPAMLTAHRVHLGQGYGDDIREISAHDEIEKLFASRFPSRNTVKRDFNFPKELDHGTKGRPKNVDFAILDPSGKNIDALIEVKRTSSKSHALKREVDKDLARLLLLSQQLDCPCYLLVCGDTTSIQAQLENCDAYLSFEFHPSFQDRHFSTSSIRCTSEYEDLLTSTQIKRGHTRLQGIKSEGPNSVMLWQVAANMHRLTNNRPYRFRIDGVAIEQ